MAGTDPLTLKTISLGADHSYAFDEASGSLIDYAGSNNGTASGTPVYQVDDQRGLASAISFDGSTDLFTLASNILNGASAYTIEAVVNLDATAAAQIVFDERDGSGDGVILFFASGGIPRAIHNGSGGVDGPSISAGSWHHIHVVWNGSTLTVYTDGVAGTPVSIATAVSTTVQPTIGRRSYSSAQFLGGDLSHVAIYPTALSQSDIDDLITAAADLGSYYTLTGGHLGGVIGQPLRGRM